MQKVTNLALKILHKLRVLHLLLFLERTIGWRRHVIVLLYHHIRDDNETLLPLSQVEEGVTQSAFRTQLTILQDWYAPIGASDVGDLFSSGNPLRHDSLYVTFDDGYRDNLTIASPILHELDISATVFLPTGFIGTRRRLWWIRLNDVIRKLPASAKHQVGQHLCQWPEMARALAESSLEDHHGRRELRVRFAQRLEGMPDEEKESFLDALTGVVEPDATTTMPLLNWEEIHSMSRDGFSFGAHTVTHPRMTTLTPNQIDAELFDSAALVEAKTGLRPTEFAYPYGDLNEAVEESVRHAGYQIAFAANPGTARPGQTPKMRIPRMQLGESDKSRLLALVVVLKMSKYLPSVTRPLLSRFFGEPYEV